MDGMSKKRKDWFLGGDSECGPRPPQRGDAVRLVLLGPPGVGKGVQACLLSEHTGACQLSTGELFRHARHTLPEHLTPAMKVALEAMHKGELVPDDIVCEMVRERLTCMKCPTGFLLDGFPRTTMQAQFLAHLLASQAVALDAAVCYELDRDEIITRLSGRRACTQCGATFHLKTMPPKEAGVCDQCGGSLIQRDDDRPESISVRLDVYEKSTRPLIDFYASRGQLLRVSAHGSPGEVFERSIEALESRRASDK